MVSPRRPGTPRSRSRADLNLPRENLPQRSAPARGTSPMPRESESPGPKSAMAPVPRRPRISARAQAGVKAASATTKSASARPPVTRSGTGRRVAPARPTSAPRPNAGLRTTTPGQGIPVSTVTSAKGWTSSLGWQALVVLGVVILAITIVLPSIRTYREQQANLAALEAERDTARQEVTDLGAELARWQDPAFIVAQARERLAFVFPGEIPYRVTDPSVVIAPETPAAADSIAEWETGTWYEHLWGSVTAIGNNE